MYCSFAELEKYINYQIVHHHIVMTARYKTTRSSQGKILSWNYIFNDWTQLRRGSLRGVFFVRHIQSSLNIDYIEPNCKCLRFTNGTPSSSSFNYGIFCIFSLYYFVIRSILISFILTKFKYIISFVFITTSLSRVTFTADTCWLHKLGSHWCCFVIFLVLFYYRFVMNKKKPKK